MPDDKDDIYSRDQAAAKAAREAADKAAATKAAATNAGLREAAKAEAAQVDRMVGTAPTAGQLQNPASPDPMDGESDLAYKTRMARQQPHPAHPPETEGQKQAREAAHVPPIHPAESDDERKRVALAKLSDEDRRVLGL